MNCPHCDDARNAGAWGATILALAILALLWPAHAKDRSQWADAAHKDWYNKAQTTLAARKRLNFASCCDHSEVVKTQFKVDKTSGADAWYYLENEKWKRIPDDIIHWGESGPEGEPVLFKSGTYETCFWPPEGGI